MKEIKLVETNGGSLANPHLEEMADDYTKRVRRVSEQDTDIVQPEEKKVDESKTKEIKKVYDSYESIFKREVRAKNDTRARQITARLKSFPLADIIKAFTNGSKDEFLCGDNKENKFYATIDYFIRNDANIEKYLDGKVEENEYLIGNKKVSKEEFEEMRSQL
jgi:hypothetical protein